MWYCAADEFDAIKKLISAEKLDKKKGLGIIAVKVDTLDL